ncbi:molybdate transport system regulatory protein [Halorientalis persicus]|jgi:molybdate transport system regulatory protein|uniref:Molybdate transport system regulatory protein n=1 Tax=Halorientalis persicus TaxID=1367881 RepID=A0A1H8M1M8_9EURY|nr:TOBE domain-containing protein [Halorientalis persicus]SEO11314.1 molybdate transport system regulatory protein [Halorientalis persicus]
MDVSPDFDVQLGRDGVALTVRDRELLAAIDEDGSLNAAAESLGRSYAHAQRRVVELEDAFGSLVDRSRGGGGGGGSELTDRARELLATFDRVRAEFAGVAETDETVLSGRVIDRDGELATVETAAGRIRAVTPPDCTEVGVTIRADAVTLNRPAEAPEPGGTSARNRFEGEVVGVDHGETLARVTVAVEPGLHLTALVTVESIERLGLTPGTAVVATFKATATRAVARAES